MNLRNWNFQQHWALAHVMLLPTVACSNQQATAAYNLPASAMPSLP